MKAAIIGGSLSGCMAAILLGRAGHGVTVYERSKAGLVGRGGGLTTSRKVLDEMKSRDLLDAGFPASRFDTLRMCKRMEVDRAALVEEIDGFGERLERAGSDAVGLF
ncbi:MAG: hypothetical protein F4103_03815, partial [Boseongicola sp. SB0673_bin_14]|nr:hypothetical protein [Boseongicola sp. SB0673_bin_14]